MKGKNMSKKVNLDASLGEFVIDYPQSREIFENFELDYCCGGKKNLAVAAKEKNIDLEEFQSLLQKIVDEKPRIGRNKSWTNESLNNIVNHVEEDHHKFAWEKLHSIELVLNKLINVHGEKHGDFLLELKNIFIKFKEKLEKHLKLEEDIIFSYVRELDEASSSSRQYQWQKQEHKLAEKFYLTKETIELLQAEHEEAGEMLRQIKSFTSNYELPDYACASFVKLYADLESLEDDLHTHINLENTVLFPKIIKLIE